MGLLDYIKANTPRSTRPVANPLTVINQGLLNPNQYNAPAANRFKDSMFGLLGIVPGVGDAASAAESADLFNRGENVAGSMAALGALPLVPSLGGLFAHTVYHGSPHKFTKFDMSKIGTGEGAQAYGHGLYFAENPGVARSYQQGLSQSAPRVMTWKGQPIGFDDLKSVAEQYANNLPAEQRAFALDGMTRMLRDQSGYGTPKFYDQLKQVKSKIAKNLKQANALKGSQYDSQATRQWYEQFKTMLDDIQVEYPGNLYKVDIPDEAIPRMLDWDKRMYEQSPDVMQKMPGLFDSGKRYNQISEEMDALMWQGKLDSPEWNALRDEAKAIRESLGYAPNDTGEEVIRKLGGNVKAAEYLKAQGIPGIRYLDGMSRGKGGTSNFVLFDDQLPRILEINGQPTGLLSYADEAAQAAKKDGGLLDISKWKANDIFGNGKQIEYLSPDGKSAVVQQTMPSGETVFYPAEVNADYGWVSPDMYKPFSTFDEARNKIKGMRVSDSLKKRNVERYGDIPNTWAGEAKKIAKKLIDSGIDIAKFSGSTQSKSKYIELADGRKIRMSDHDLPLFYEGADIDFRYGNDISELMNKLK